MRACIDSLRQHSSISLHENAGGLAHHRPRAWTHVRHRLRGGSVHGSTEGVNVFAAHIASVQHKIVHYSRLSFLHPHCLHVLTKCNQRGTRTGPREGSTIGASGPNVRLAPTEQQVPTHFAMRVCRLSRSGIATPFKYAITRETPAAAAAGAQNCTCIAEANFKQGLNGTHSRAHLQRQVNMPGMWPRQMYGGQCSPGKSPGG